MKPQKDIALGTSKNLTIPLSNPKEHHVLARAFLLLTGRIDCNGMKRLKNVRFWRTANIPSINLISCFGLPQTKGPLHCQRAFLLFQVNAKAVKPSGLPS